MSSLEHLDSLRRENQELLQRLNRRQATAAKTPQPEVRTERNGGVFDVVEDLGNLRVSENCPKVSRSALLNPRNSWNSPQTGAEMASGCLTGEEATCLSEDTVCDVLLQDRANGRLRVRVHPTSQTKPESVVSQEQRQRAVGRVRFPPEDDEPESVSESDRPRVQPLLGYDWIAGLLDAESSRTERSKQFFSELRTFRQVNREECVHSVSSRLPSAADLWSPSVEGVEDGVTNHDRVPDSHQCTFCYRINSRLFAAPLDPQAACPVCRMPKEKHPHSEKQPAFIRVSIPRATLLPAYRYKAHRRCSFDPSDSLGLPSHCLSGWTNISMGAGSKMSSLDLRNSMEIRPNPGTVPSAQDERQMGLSGSWASGRQSSDGLPELSRLARYQFQHGTATRTKPFY